MLAFLMAISATPLLLGAKHVRVSTYPRLSFHETPAARAALAFCVKKGASLTSVIAFFSDFT